jgi:hypothetical protein
VLLQAGPDPLLLAASPPGDQRAQQLERTLGPRLPKYYRGVAAAEHTAIRATLGSVYAALGSVSKMDIEGGQKQ